MALLLEETLHFENMKRKTIVLALNKFYKNKDVKIMDAITESKKRNAKLENVLKVRLSS